MPYSSGAKMFLEFLILKFISVLIGLAFAVYGVFALARKQVVLGRPAMAASLHITGKTALAFSAGVLFCRAWVESAAWPQPWMSPWICAALALCGSSVMLPPFWQMGRALVVGLPPVAEPLVTRGLFSITRNPIYLGADLMMIASFLLVPHPVNVIASAAGIWLHHRIILGEEAFLEKAHGEAYQRYRAQVPRYL
jgi:protein-S-isoprenylcysteine O-methyltransferase Ste14